MARGGRKSGANDLFAVASVDLRAVLEPIIKEMTDEYELSKSQNYGFADYASSIGAYAYLEAHTGLDQSRISRILYSQTFATFDVAERLLIAVGQEHALRDGRCLVVPNPYMNEERWRARMAQNGCEGDDFLFS